MQGGVGNGTSVRTMPVMVVGADTPPGRTIVDRLIEPEREIRAFVTDLDAAEELKRAGVKVAVGDVSDESHLSGACLNCFSVVFVDTAATDGRTRSFADDPATVRTGWAAAAATAGVQRVIWVVDVEPPPVRGIETAVVEPGRPDLADEVFRLDDAARLD